MDKPDMLDGDKDDLGYQLNVNRVSPYFFLNTLKGNKNLPKAGLKDKMEILKPKVDKKWRRLSRPKMHSSFSTVNTNPERVERPTFLQSILNYSSIYRKWGR